MFSKLPGLPGLPIIGSPYMCLLPYKDMLAVGEMWLRKVKLLSFNLFGMPVVILNDPEHIKSLLESTAHNEKGFEYTCFRPWLREGLLVSHGKKWTMRRKLLTPTFHFEILESNISGIWKNANIFIEKLNSTNGQPINIDEYVRPYTLDVICETAMGVELNAQKNEAPEYVAALKGATEVVLRRALRIWLQAEWLFKLTPKAFSYLNDLKVLHDFSEGVIASKKKMFKTEMNANHPPRKRRAFLDSLLELDEQNAGVLSPLDIREEVDTFMFEGHDTTSAAIVFMLYLLANHPEAQEEALEEQMAIFGDDWREPTMKDLQAMNYLEMVIKESLRLFPSVPYVSRTLTQDLVLYDGLVIPAGTNCGVCVYYTHRHRDYWEEPEEFRPERFAPGTTRHPFSYLAFSAGPRNCIGQKFAMLELKTTMSGLIRKCRLEAVTKEVCVEPVVILQNYEPIYLKVHPR